MSWLSSTLHLSTKLSVEKTSDHPVNRVIYANGRSVETQSKLWWTHSTSSEKGGVVNKNLPSMSSFTAWLWTAYMPLLTLQWYDPVFVLKTELMVWLFPDTTSWLSSLYHRYSHPEETLMWQLKETESPVCITLCMGFCISVTLGFVSVGWQ